MCDFYSITTYPETIRALFREEKDRTTHPDGYGRSWFCELYRAWDGRHGAISFMRRVGRSCDLKMVWLRL
ncbi:MAG: hypothetical protein ABIO35_08055 [Nitrobacter sp.]